MNGFSAYLRLEWDTYRGSPLRDTLNISEYDPTSAITVPTKIHTIARPEISFFTKPILSISQQEKYNPPIWRDVNI